MVRINDLASSAPSACPQSCSGHGYCNDGTTCLCFDGWNGGAADCSTRECATGTAWFDKAASLHTAHQAVECSGAGHCDRRTGNCMCFFGYSGRNCQRLTCPSNCNNRGICSTVYDIHMTSGADYYDQATRLTGADITDADGMSEAFTSWEKGTMTMCDCPQGWTGFDCSQRMCPKADDPVTTGQVNRKFTLSVTSASTMGGRLKIQFQNDKTAYLDLAAAKRTDSLCAHGIMASPKIKEAGCVVSGTDTDADFLIELKNFPYFAEENNLHYHFGNPALTDFWCDTSGTTGGVACLFEEAVDTNVKEFAYCANRGLCDFDTGICKCFRGYGGVACEEQTFDPTATIENTPSEIVHVGGLDFTSAVLQIGAERSSSSAYKMLECIAGDEVVFEVGGNGALEFPKLSVETGGLQIASGGLTISKDGMLLKNQRSAAVDSVLGTGTTYTTDDAVSPIEVRTATTDTTASFLFGAFNQGVKKFTIRNDGNTNFWSVGLSLTGGMSVGSDGFKVSGGITIQDGGVKVNGGMSIELDGLRVTGATSVMSGGMGVQNGGLTISAGGFRILNGGVTLAADGLKVEAGGMSILAGGMHVTEGVSVMSGGLHVTGGMTLARQGFYVTGGLTIAADGLHVTGGFTMPDVYDMIITTNEDDFGVETQSYSTAMAFTVGASDDVGPGGSLTIQSGRGHDTSSGDVVIRTASDAACTGADCRSGSVLVYTGAVASGGNSGKIYIGSGASANLAGGAVTIAPGSGSEAADPGATLTIAAGATTDAGETGGRVFLQSGFSAEESSGGVLLTTPAGGVAGASGDIVIATGDGSAGNSGIVHIGTGDGASGAGGPIWLTGGKSTAGVGVDMSVTAGLSDDAPGGRVAFISGGSAVTTSGAVLVHTVDAGDAGVSGMLVLSTGASSSANSGMLHIGTGDAASGAGGTIRVTVGEGDILAFPSGGTFRAGDTSHASSVGGKLSLVSGHSGALSSGSVLIETLDAVIAGSGTSGMIALSTGRASASDSGAIFIGSGDSDSGRGGHIFVSAGTGDTGPGGAITVTAGKTSGDTNLGGDVVVVAGDSAYMDQNSGDVVFIPGTSTKGTPVPGKFEVYPYSGYANPFLRVDKSAGIKFVDYDTSTAYLELDVTNHINLESNNEMRITRGGLDITGGFSVQTGGLHVKHESTMDLGVTIADKLVVAGGFVGTAGATVIDTGLKVTGGGLSVIGGVSATVVSVLNSGLVIKDPTGALKGLHLADKLDVTGSVTITATGVTITEGTGDAGSGFVVTAGGATVANGVTLADVGLKTTNSGGVGLNIQKGGLSITLVGLTIGADGMTVGGGAVIGDGVVVEANGVTIQSTGLDIDATTTGLTIVNGGISHDGDAVAIQGTAPGAGTSGAAITGGVRITAGGIDITTGLTVADEGIEAIGVGGGVAGGLTVTVGAVSITGGLEVSTTAGATGMVLSDGKVVVTGGGVVINGGLGVTGNTATNYAMHVYSDGMVVTAGDIDVAGGVAATGVMTVTGGSKMTGLTVTAGGIATDTLTLAANGMSVADDLDCDAGLAVTGGLVLTNGLTVGNVVEVQATGLIVAGAMTVDSGLYVSGDFNVDGGLTIVANGIAIATATTLTGATVTAGGLQVGGDLTVTDGGMTVTDAIAVDGKIDVAGGLTAAGALDVVGGELNVAGGLTVDGSLTVADSLVITGNAAFGRDLSVENKLVANGGLDVGGTLSVTAGGLVVSNTGFTDIGSAGGGLTVTAGGLTIDSGGLTATGHVDIADNVEFASGTDLATAAASAPQLELYTVGLNAAAMTNAGATSIGSSSAVTTTVHTLTVNKGANAVGLSVTGGLTVQTGAFDVTGGLTVTSGGLGVTGAVTVAGGSTFKGEMVIDGGLTVADTGVSASTLTAAAAVASTSLNMAGGKMSATGTNAFTGDIDVTGIFTVTGGLTVGSLGAGSGGLVKVMDTGCHVSGDVLVSAGATMSYLSIADGGLRVNNGITVDGTSGLVVTNTITASSHVTIAGTGLRCADLDIEYTAIADDTMIKGGDMDVEGNCRVNAAADGYNINAFASYSDARLKENFVDLPRSGEGSALDRVDQLMGVLYKWNATAWEDVYCVDVPDRDLHAGVLAQNLRAVLPEAVNESEMNGVPLLQVDFSAIVSLLVGAARDVDVLTEGCDELALPERDFVEGLRDLKGRVLALRAGAERMWGMEAGAEGAMAVAQRRVSDLEEEYSALMLHNARLRERAALQGMV